MPTAFLTTTDDDMPTLIKGMDAKLDLIAQRIAATLAVPGASTIVSTTPAAPSTPAADLSTPTTPPAATTAPTPAPADDGYGAITTVFDGFNSSWYRHANPDVVAAGMTMFGHYLTNGRAEGRRPYEGAAATRDAAVVGALPPLDLSTMQLWNYDRPWMASEWNTWGPEPFRYSHVYPVGSNFVLYAVGSDVVFYADSQAFPELKGGPGPQDNDQYGIGAGVRKGLWELDVTLPKLRSGVVVAPLWLFCQSTGDEIDFEIPGTGALSTTLHVAGPPVATKNYPELGDLSGQRHTFAIACDLDDATMPWIEQRLDGKVLVRWEKKDVPSWPAGRLSPILEMWDAPDSMEAWAGKFTPLGQDELMTMTVHGYRFTAAT